MQAGVSAGSPTVQDVLETYVESADRRPDLDSEGEVPFCTGSSSEISDSRHLAQQK
jgi:hypothetical protein